MAKIIQNSFATPENIFTNCLFLRGGGFSGEPHKNVTSSGVRILPELIASVGRGIIDTLNVSASYNALRIYGHLTSTDIIPVISLGSNYFLNGVTTAQVNPKVELYTFGYSAKDNKGNLSQYQAEISTSVDTVSGTLNTYFEKSSKLTTTPRKAERCFSASVRGRVIFRIQFSNISQSGVGFDFDITVSDCYLYEGAYANPSYRLDYLSKVGNDPNTIYQVPLDGYLLPENLPVRAREIEFNGDIISKRYKDHPNASYVTAFIGYRYGTSGIHYAIRGSVYVFPKDYSYWGQFRKYDMKLWYQYYNSAWRSVQNTITEDTSYKKNMSSEMDVDLYTPNISFRCYASGTNLYSYIDFGKTNGTVPKYEYMKIVFMPDVYITAGNNGIIWQHIGENRYESR